MFMYLLIDCDKIIIVVILLFRCYNLYSDAEDKYETRSSLLIVFYLIQHILCLYLEAAVATVFEIATFPLAKVLHSRSIKNGFFSF